MWRVVMTLLEAFLFAGVLGAALGSLSAVHFLHMLRAPRVLRSGRVSLIMAVTGSAPRLEALFGALARQHLRPRRLVVAVECESDPAYQRVQSCRELLPFPVDLVVSGLAESSGQKSWNLLAALSLVDDQDDAVVLLDADVLPGPEWLSHLASPVLSGSYDVVSGYRWQWMSHWRPAALVIAAIDRSIALLPRLPGCFMPWGGSVALGRTALERIDRDRWLGRSISDDCALGLEVKRLGLRALVRRVLLVRSPLEGSARSLWRFARRQYQMIRFYMPGVWWLGMLIVALRAWTWMILLLPFGVSHRGLWLAAMYAFVLWGVILQRRVAERLGLEDASSHWLPSVLTVLVKPLIDFLHLALMASAATSRVVAWGHVRYLVRGATDVRLISRQAWGSGRG